jgi:mannose-6-phosphate isomerase-like protein (cupin superfamily)
MDDSVERRGRAEFDYLLHGGTAPIRAQWYFREENRLPVAVQRWTFPPGGTEGVHAHPGHTEADAHPGPLDELYLLVRGHVTMLLADRSVDLGPGDALLAPAGVPHGVRNDGPEPAEFVVVWGAPGTGLDCECRPDGPALGRRTRRRGPRHRSRPSRRNAMTTPHTRLPRMSAAASTGCGGGQGSPLGTTGNSPAGRSGSWWTDAGR